MAVNKKFPKNVIRNHKIAMMYLDGYTFEQIGIEFGITRQRANKIWLDHHKDDYKLLLKERVKRKKGEDYDI